MADFIVGSPARFDDFLFRTDFVEDLWESLEKHNILLLAPRRTGKTSVMYRMLDEPKYGWLVIHLNVEDLKTPADFIVSLIDAIHEHQPRYLREALAKSWGFYQNLGRIEDKAFEFELELRKARKNHKQLAGAKLVTTRRFSALRPVAASSLTSFPTCSPACSPSPRMNMAYFFTGFKNQGQVPEKESPLACWRLREPDRRT